MTAPEKKQSKPYDAADYLESDDDIAAYLDEVRQQSDPDLLERALEAAERARRRIMPRWA